MRKVMDGILGREEGMLGNGGKVTCGVVVGMVGKLGSGGRVALGREGWVVGNVGIAESGGIDVAVGFGKVGMVGNPGIDGILVCSS